MKKTLRFSLVGLLLAFCFSGGVKAQTVFDFDNNSTEYFGMTGRSSGSGASYVADGEFNEDKTVTVGGVSITVTASEANAQTRNRLWSKAPVLRLYNGTLTVKANKAIKSIEFTGNTSFNISTTTGTLNTTEKKWTGDATEVVFTVAKNTQISTITVYLDGEGGGTVDPQPTPEVNSIADFKALALNTEAKLNLSNAKVVYCWTSSNGNTSVYVRDVSGAIVFDCRAPYAAVGANFSTGAELNGSIVLKNYDYKNLPQASATANTNVDNLTIKAGVAATPVSCTVADAKNYLCDLVTMSNVNVISDEAETPKFYATNGTEQVQIYNSFHIAAFDDLSAFVGESKTITGIMIIYDTTYEIYPIENGITTGINNVTTDVLNENAPIYNLAGQRVSKDTKGILIQNGKKFVNNK